MTQGLQKHKRMCGYIMKNIVGFFKNLHYVIENNISLQNRS